VQKGVQTSTTTGISVVDASTKTTTSSKKAPVAYAYVYINSAVTRKYYIRRLKQFFDFLELPGDLE
jgi:hypothetical protein